MAFAIVFCSAAIKSIVQVFFVSMAESFGQTRGGFALSAAVFMAVFGIASPIVGWVGDRTGPKRVLVGGLQAAGLALLGCALLPSYWLFVAFYGIVAASALAAMTYVPVGILVDRMVPEKRMGIAYAALTSAAAIGFIVLSPAWVFAQGVVHWRQVFFGTGLTFLLPLQILAIRYLPDLPAAQLPAAGLPSGATLRKIVTTRAFVPLSLGFCGCGATMAFIDVHMVAHFQDVALTPPQIAAVMVVFGVAEWLSGFIAGWLCDRLPKGSVIAGFYGLRAVSLFLLAAMPNLTGATAFAVVFGFSYMGTVVGTSTYTLSTFDEANRGLAFGGIWMMHQLGAVLSAQLGASSFDTAASYRGAILAVGTVAAVSAIVSLVMLPPTPLPAATTAETADV